MGSMGTPRTATTRRSVLVVAALLAGACSGATGPEGAFDFETREVFGFPSLVPQAKVVNGGDIQFTGLIITPTTNYSVVGQLARPTSRSVVVTVLGTPSQTGGAKFDTQNYFAATVKNLHKGSYDVRLIFIVESTERDSTDVLHQSVAVP